MMELERHYRSGESPTLQRLKSRTEEKLPEYTPRNAGPLWVDESKLEPGDSSEPDGVWLSMKYEIPRMLKRVRGRL